MLLVIFNHTGAFGFCRFVETQSPVLFWFYLACAVLCTMGVPLFFMVSGALLVDREESLSTLYRRRVLRVAVVIALFSALQYLFAVRFQGAEFDMAYFLRTVYTGQIVTPYWFLYAYLALMMMLPFIRRMARGMSRAEYRYFALLYLLLVGVLPIAQYLILRQEVVVNLDLPMVMTASVFFFVMGGCYNRLAMDELTNRRLLWLALASALCVAVSAGMTRYKAVVTGELSEGASQTFLACLQMIPATTVFLAARKLFAARRCPPALAAVIRSAGSCTFGIYLLHAMIMDRLLPLFYFLRERIDTFPACLVYVLAVFLCGYGITLVLKRIPLLGRLL